MEVSSPASNGAGATMCCRASSSYPSHVRACSAAAPAFVACPSFLPIKLGSLLSPNGSQVYRSSIWGATAVGLASSCGTVPRLVCAPRLFQNRSEPVERSCGIARAYMETTNPVMRFLNKVWGALPVVGLISRLVSPEGGVGTDRIRFEEFCTRVGRNCTREASSAFRVLEDRYGKVAKAPFLLIWCWAAALGAGLLKSEDFLMGASRLRVSYDLQYEVENLDLLMDEATKKREKSGSKARDVPMEARAEKALEAICKCCTGRTTIAEEDAPLLSAILKVVFPTADEEQIDLAVASRLYDPFGGASSSPDDGQNLNEQDAADQQSQSVLQ